ncbi:hypothetical protein Pmani_022907 [Petrolisthes manimaculis]|uniref:Galactokinase n=1 Tax=Petrolisthes manimaculis TaxID=1843537 RepID=A0AAE1PD22_9EUCA|nr:hypothetical protein Pmani_022907 [Petrolisthes manimaculis]
MPEMVQTSQCHNEATDNTQSEMNTKSPPVVKVPTDGEQGQRVAALEESFTTEFSHPPQFFVRAPGRVNLIGEHIDYCGYAVFPMAVEQDIIMAVATNSSSKLNLCNVDQSYLSYSCDINNFEIDPSVAVWHNYVLCGIRGIREEGGLVGPLTGLNIAVSGNIPPSSGLSSSSALVCATALAVAHAHHLSLARDMLAEICARCERHVGTQGGGMDQAIAFLATAGEAKMIEFNPLKATAVQLPAGGTFVVANSLAQANKAANSNYNCRVMECRLATKIIAKRAGLSWENYQRLGELQVAVKKSLPEMVEMVKEILEPRPYTKQEVATLLDTTTNHLDNVVLSENTRDIQEFYLHDRALHVFSEANRVWEFRRVCEEGREGALHKLGKIMLASHRSTQRMYDCSHPKLDQLVDLSEGLALGGRLTGAGWGGCMVALVEESKAEEYKRKLEKEFYSHEPAAKGKNISTFLFSTRPGPAACVYIK